MTKKRARRNTQPSSPTINDNDANDDNWNRRDFVEQKDLERVSEHTNFDEIKKTIDFHEKFKTKTEKYRLQQSL
ncbi:hypothetical protein LXL04_025182 [Taraxacum kok-saghyz]